MRCCRSSRRLPSGLANGGKKLPTGNYILRLTTSKRINDGTITGVAERTFQIDVTPPSITSRSASPSTFYPIVDHFRDSASLRGILSERAASTTIQIFNSRGSWVRSLKLGARPAGVLSGIWNGRTASGTLLALGTYRFRFVVQDVAGNRSTSSMAYVNTLWRKAVPRTVSTVVTPESALAGVAIGACSAVFHSSAWSGGYSYDSNYYYDPSCDPSNGDDLAATREAFTLRSAIMYGNIRVDTYGHAELPGYSDFGVILYADRYGNPTDKGAALSSTLGWHAGPSVPITSYAQGHTFSCWIVTLDGNWYEVGSLRVTYTYYVLS